MTSSTHDADLKGNNFRRTLHPRSFTPVACIFSELDGGGGGGGGFQSPAPVQKVKKKPGLDRVKRQLHRIHVVAVAGTVEQCRQCVWSCGSL